MNNYWIDRIKYNDKEIDDFLKSLKPLYKDVFKNINAEIERFYGRYAIENDLSLVEVRKRLDRSQLQSYREENKKYYDMINRLCRDEKNIIDKEKLKLFKNELRAQSAKAYISRLEELKTRFKCTLIESGAEEIKMFENRLSKIYTDNYLMSNYELDKQKSFSIGVKKPTLEALKVLLRKKWLGENFSDRIWSNKEKLLGQLNTTFLQGVAQGFNPKKIAKLMQKNVDSSYSNCERLCRTESAYVSEEATRVAYNDQNVKKYQFLATLDNKTSALCQDYDNRVFNVDEIEVGVNYPPLHPNCRSTTTPYFEPDEIDKMFDEAKRVARDNNGKLYDVPADMTYKEWVKFVK